MSFLEQFVDDYHNALSLSNLGSFGFVAGNEGCLVRILNHVSIRGL